jgi:hypothetical protein
MSSDLKLVDQYLAAGDRFAQGDNELVPFLKKNRGAFEVALAQLLNARDRRAAGRLVFYPVVQVGASISVDSDLGRAAAALLGPDFPVTTNKQGERVYFAGDLFFWWCENREAYDSYPLLEEWSEREFARRVVVPMYRAACARE